MGRFNFDRSRVIARRQKTDDEFRLQQAKCLVHNTRLREADLTRGHDGLAPWSNAWWSSLRKLDQVRTARIQAEHEIVRQGGNPYDAIS